MYPDNKPWLSKELKHCLYEKKPAFLKGDKMTVRDKETEFRLTALKSKQQFKYKMEQGFCTGNAKQALEGLHVTMGRDKQKQKVNGDAWGEFVIDLKNHYARFDTIDFHAELEDTRKNTLIHTITTG